MTTRQAVSARSGILDADKEGFLRSEGSLLQTIGRAARNAHGKAMRYADNIIGSMRPAKLAFGSLIELCAAITEQRLVLMQAVATQEHTTVESLADVLGQSRETVRRDADA